MIELRNVHKSFGAREILRGLSLEVPEGQNTVIIGYSGTGKSVTLKCIIGLLQPDPGSYLSARPRWRPTLPSKDGSFRMTDFLTFAGIDPRSRGQ